MNKACIHDFQIQILSKDIVSTKKKFLIFLPKASQSICGYLYVRSLLLYYKYSHCSLQFIYFIFLKVYCIYILLKHILCI